MYSLVLRGRKVDDSEKLQLRQQKERFFFVFIFNVQMSKNDDLNLRKD